MKRILRQAGHLFIFLTSALSTQAQSGISDCANARILCDKNPIQLPGSMDGGAIQESLLPACFPEDFTETNSMWFKWKVATGGVLQFTLLPFDETDDVDFALFRISSLDICHGDWEVVRCSAAGPNLGDENTSAAACTGATGLNEQAEKTTLNAGCPADEVNFLKPVVVQPGEYYALFVNNYRSSGPIALEWGGTCVFETIPENCESVSTGVSNLNTSGIMASSLYPNPGTGEVTVAIESNRTRPCTIQLISTGGQIHLQQFTEIHEGRNTIKIPIDSLNSGVYFIKIRSENDISVLRFAKQ